VGDEGLEGTVAEFVRSIMDPLWRALNATEDAESATDAWAQVSEGFANASEAFTLEKLSELFGKASNEVSANWRKFTGAVDWREPWIQYMFAVELSLFLSFVLMWWFRFSAEAKMVLFLTVLALCGGASLFNSWAMADENWKLFSSQKYFDESGTFLAVVWCAPLLCLSFCLLIAILLDVARLLVSVKREQLMRKKRKGEKQKQTESAVEPAAKTSSTLRKR